MHLKTIYKNKSALKWIFIFAFVCGLLSIALFIKLYLDDLLINFWAFTLPFLGIALIRIGVSESKVKSIHFDKTNSHFLIKKESMFRHQNIVLDLNEASVELKVPNKNTIAWHPRHFVLFPRYVLTIMKNGEKVVELKSDVLSSNNDRLKKVYSKIKRIKNSNIKSLENP